MTEADLMREGLSLMISGMGFVLVFLFLLILAIQVMSATINRLFPATENTVSPSPVGALSVNDRVRLHAAIVAAIHHHRRLHGESSGDML